MMPRRYLLPAIFGIAALLVPILVIGVVAWLSMDSVQSDFRQRAERNLDLMDTHARRAFANQQSSMAAIQERVQGMDWTQIAQSEEIWRFLRATTVGSVSTGFALAGPDGRIVSTARSTVFPSPRIDISTRDYVRAIWTGQRGLAIGQVIDASLVGFTHFPMGIARLGGNGQPDGGIIVSGASPDFFGEYYARLLQNPADEAVLMRGDGAVLACQPAARACQQTIHGRTITDLMRNRDSGFAELARPDGGERVYGFRRVPGQDVVVAYSIDQDALKAARWTRTVSVGVPLALIALAILLCGFLLTRHFLRR